jgi:hypothetical protein
VQLVADGTALTWGFDNSFPLYRVQVGTDSSGARTVVTMLTPPVDQPHWPLAGQVVELIPWGALLPNGEKVAESSGELFRVQDSYDPDQARFTLATPVDAGFGEEWHHRADRTELEAGPQFHYLRVWNRGADLTSPPAVPCPAGTDVPLGKTGLQVRIDGTQRTAGDHWIIAVRPHTPDRVVPWDLETGRAPHGFRRWVAPLAVIRWEATAGSTATGTVVDDCREWFPPLTRTRGCCTFTVGDGVNSHGSFASIQDAIDHLPDEGGEVCLLPGRYLQRFRIEDRRGVTVHGCGRQTVVVAPDSGGPVAAVVASSGVRLRSFVVEAPDVVGVEVHTPPGHRQPVRDVELRDLLLRARDRSAVDVQGADGVRILGCHVAVEALQVPFGTGGAGTEPGVFVGADDVLIEGNAIEIRGAIRRLRTPLGGLQIGGGSEHVEIRRNRIGGGNGNGITLGSVRYVPPAEVDKIESDYLTIMTAGRRFGGPSVIAVDENGCIHIDPGGGDGGDGGGGDDELVPVSEGPVTDLVVRDNVIRGMGANGIATHHAPARLVGLIHVEDVIIDTNHVERCMGVEGRPPREGSQSLLIAAFGGIVLGVGMRIVIRDNLIQDNGSRFEHAICGVFLGLAEGVLVQRNRVFGNGRWSVRPAAGPRGGIVALRVFGRAPSSPDGADEARLPLMRPAAAIRDNVVAQPCGRALIVIAAGAVSVTDNLLAATAAPTITDEQVPDRERGAREAFNAKNVAGDLPGAYAALGGLAGATGPATGLAVLVANLGKSASAGNAPFQVHNMMASSAVRGPVGAAVNGTIAFNDNQVVLEAPAGMRGESSVLLFTADDLSVADNVSTVHGQIGLTTNGWLVGWSVRVTGNRFTEPPGQAMVSAFTTGLLNTTALNHSTHCLLALGSLVLDEGNFAEVQLFDKDACRNLRQSIDQGRQLGHQIDS